MNPIYLVTGAAGHLGRAVIDELNNKGMESRAFVLEGEKNIPENIPIFYGDVFNKESIKLCFEGLDSSNLVVIHCAGIVSIASKVSDLLYNVNVVGTMNIADLCLEYGVRRLVYVSSVHAIPEKPRGEFISEVSDFSPDYVIGSYAKTKAIATNYVLNKAKEGLNVCVVHPSGIMGPNDYSNGYTTSIIRDYYQGKLKLGIRGGYDFVDVRDVASGIVKACETGKSGECYILSNKFFTVKEILDLLYDLTNRNHVRFYIPVRFIKLFSKFAELYYSLLKRKPLFTPYSIYTLSSNALFSHEKASNELGYKPRDMKDTLNDIISWIEHMEEENQR